LIGCASSSIENALVPISNCMCEGHDQVYECRVTGSGATVWRGSAFNCDDTGNEIILLYSRFGTAEVCNDGAIIGRIISVENDTYVSQLTVVVSAKMTGKSINCFHDGPAGAPEELIGSSVLTLTTGNANL
jgi:hypothetical protein